MIPLLKRHEIQVLLDAKFSPAEVVARDAAWQRSGLSADVLCADKPFAAGTLRGWSSRLRRPLAPTFLGLRPRDPAAVAPAAEFVVEVGAARVRVAPGFGPVFLGALVAVRSGDVR